MDNEIIGPFIGMLLIVLTIALFFFRKNLERKKKMSPSDSLLKLIQTKKQSDFSNKPIFISYRREDSSGYALALYHELLKWYDKNIIFKDFHNIEPGEDFEQAIDSALNSCGILLVIIGDKWSNIISERLKLPSRDFVSLEIATALAKNIYTIPITINGAIMPNESELPNDLKKLTSRQSLNIDQTKFDTDIKKLIEVIDKRLGIQRKP